MEVSNNSEYVKKLDLIQKNIHCLLLKGSGFKKNGRTFNKECDEGLVQVINFQMGQYPIGNYEIPGVRESLYGYFTVNLGIFIPEISELEREENFRNRFVQEYNCHVRIRLGNLCGKGDFWWDLSQDENVILNDIDMQINHYAFKFFDDLSSRNKIIENLIFYCNNYSIISRKYLDIGLIAYKMGDIVLAKELINKHYLNTNLKPHKEYVYKLAKKIGIDLNKR